MLRSVCLSFTIKNVNWLHVCRLSAKRVCVSAQRGHIYTCEFMDFMYLCRVCTFVAVFVMHPVQVVDGVHRVELDLGEVLVADPVELRGGVGGRRPRHVLGSHGGLTGRTSRTSE